MSHRKAIYLVILFFALASITVFAAIHSKLQENQELQNQFPVVDINTAESTEIDRIKLRQARSSKYDLKDKGITKQNIRNFTIKETDPPILFDLIPSHAPALQAIPASQSSAVIIGEVTSSEAHLSNDKTAVYSEFIVRVEGVIKNDSSKTLLPNTLITTERRGGRVRFPSGKIVLRGTYGRNMPQSQRRYLFFLEYHPEGESFSIITAYELHNNHVFPLDGTTQTDVAADPFAVYKIYKDAEEASFINEVRNAIQEGQK